MDKIMNEQFKKIADEEGAYTDVSGRWVNSNGFNKFAERVVAECIAAVRTANMNSLTYTSYDVAVVESVRGIAIKSITDKFTK